MNDSKQMLWLIVPAIALARWAWAGYAAVVRDVGALDDFDGMHFG